MDAANPTTPSQKAELVICSTSQPWAMFCIHVPMLERKLPVQKSLKSRWRKARARRGISKTVVSAASVTAASVTEPWARPSAASARGKVVSSNDRGRRRAAAIDLRIRAQFR